MWSRTVSNSCFRVTTSGSRPRASGERRFCVVDVLPSKIGDHGYFKKIREEMNRGDYEAMLYDLRRLGVPSLRPRKPTLRSTRRCSVTPIQRW